MTEAQAKKKLVHMTGNTYYFKTPMAFLPFYRLPDGTAVLMDAGLAQDDSLGEAFELLGIRVSAVLLSHMHFDHIGGVPSLRRHFGTKVYAPGPVSDVCIPMHESVRLSGCAPEVQAFNERCRITPDLVLPPDARSVTVGNVGFEVIRCPGHTADHTAYVTPDDVCCLGDLLISENYLPMMNLLHIEDHAQSAHSKQQLAARRFACCVAAHKGVFPGEEYGTVVEQNERKLTETREAVKSLLQTPKTEAELTAALAETLGLAFESEIDRHTTSCSVKAFLTELLARNEIKADLQEEPAVYCTRSMSIPF